MAASVRVPREPQQRPNQTPVLAVLFRAAINRGSILHARISNDEKAKVAVEVASNGEQDKEYDFGEAHCRRRLDAEGARAALRAHTSRRGHE